MDCSSSGDDGAMTYHQHPAFVGNATHFASTYLYPNTAFAFLSASSSNDDVGVAQHAAPHYRQHLPNQANPVFSTRPLEGSTHRATGTVQSMIHSSSSTESEIKRLQPHPISTKQMRLPEVPVPHPTLTIHNYSQADKKVAEEDANGFYFVGICDFEKRGGSRDPFEYDEDDSGESYLRFNEHSPIGLVESSDSAEHGIEQRAYRAKRAEARRAAKAKSVATKLLFPRRPEGLKSFGSSSCPQSATEFHTRRIIGISSDGYGDAEYNHQASKTIMTSTRSMCQSGSTTDVIDAVMTFQPGESVNADERSSAVGVYHHSYGHDGPQTADMECFDTHRSRALGSLSVSAKTTHDTATTSQTVISVASSFARQNGKGPLARRLHDRCHSDDEAIANTSANTNMVVSKPPFDRLGSLKTLTPSVFSPPPVQQAKILSPFASSAKSAGARQSSVKLPTTTSVIGTPTTAVGNNASVPMQRKRSGGLRLDTIAAAAVTSLSSLSGILGGGSPLMLGVPPFVAPQQQRGAGVGQYGQPAVSWVNGLAAPTTTANNPTSILKQASELIINKGAAKGNDLSLTASGTYPRVMTTYFISSQSPECSREPSCVIASSHGDRGTLPHQVGAACEDGSFATLVVSFAEDAAIGLSPEESGHHNHHHHHHHENNLNKPSHRNRSVSQGAKSDNSSHNEDTSPNPGGAASRNMVAAETVTRTAWLRRREHRLARKYHLSLASDSHGLTALHWASSYSRWGWTSAAVAAKELPNQMGAALEGKKILVDAMTNEGHNDTAMFLAIHVHSGSESSDDHNGAGLVAKAFNAKTMRAMCGSAQPHGSLRCNKRQNNSIDSVAEKLSTDSPPMVHPQQRDYSLYYFPEGLRAANAYYRKHQLDEMTRSESSTADLQQNNPSRQNNSEHLIPPPPLPPKLMPHNLKAVQLLLANGASADIEWSRSRYRHALFGLVGADGKGMAIHSPTHSSRYSPLSPQQSSRTLVGYQSVQYSGSESDDDNDEGECWGGHADLCSANDVQVKFTPPSPLTPTFGSYAPSPIVTQMPKRRMTAADALAQINDTKGQPSAIRSTSFCLAGIGTAPLATTLPQPRRVSKSLVSSSVDLPAHGNMSRCSPNPRQQHNAKTMPHTQSSPLYRAPHLVPPNTLPPAATGKGPPSPASGRPPFTTPMLAVLQMLLEVGAVDPNAQDELGLYPLHYACYYTNLPAISMLLREGAVVEAMSDVTRWRQKATLRARSASAMSFQSSTTSFSPDGLDDLPIFAGRTPVDFVHPKDRAAVLRLMLPYYTYQV